jgi:aminoglycoside phosphotransferase (APT) family kinase protein
MAREARVLGNLAAAYPLAPRSGGFCDDRSVMGAPFQLVEYREGDAVGSRLPAELAARPDVGAELTGLLVEAMATLHALDPEQVGLGDLGRPDGFLGRQVEGWSRRADAAYDGAPPPAVAAIVETLRRELPTASGVSLLHCDLKFDNLLIDLSTLTPVAVVDWDMCTRGDPVFDLAVLASYWIEPTDPSEVQGLDQVPSLAPGFPSRDELVASYFIAAGREAVDIGMHLALARLRLAIAWQQLYQRWRSGALKGDRYGGFHVLARSVLEWTAETVNGE